MRDERKPSTLPEPPGASAAGSPRWWRRRAAIVVPSCVALAVAAVVVTMVPSASPDGSAPRPPTLAEQLDAMELAAIACDPSPIGFDAAALSSPIPADRANRARVALAQAGVLLLARRADAALERLDTESTADPGIVDGAWRSRRLQCLRAAERFAEAERESAEWLESLPEEHPDRAWAIAERALHLALGGRRDEAEQVAAPWLGRSLSPVASSRLRLAEALIRSGRGDHAVAVAALAGARTADGVAAPAERLPCAVFIELAMELSEASSAAGAEAPTIELCELGLELVGDDPRRVDLLRRHATARRGAGIAALEALRAMPEGGAPADGAAIERINRHFVAAAESAEELAQRLASDSRGDAPALRGAAVQCAAECWEHAGRVDEAVRAWREWLEWRPDSDTERADVLWRIAELLHGLQRFDEAVDAYRMLIRIHPNSPHAARAPIAAARALRSMGDVGAAAALLDDLLAGRGGVDPESPAYSEAILERGRLAYQAGEWEIACRRLDELTRREPFGRESSEVHLVMADSWRRLALAAEARASAPSAPSERHEAIESAQSAWRQAAEHFAFVVAHLDERDARADDRAAIARSRLARVGLAESLETIGRVEEAITAWEEVDRRHPTTESALLALDRLRRLPGVDAEAMRRRALDRIESLEPGDATLLGREAWRAWFEAPPEAVERTVASG